MAADSLADITTAIFDEMDRMCLRVGELLEEALQRVGHERWRAWIESELAFGWETARRLRAIHLAYREFPPDVLAQLPRAWQSLFALKRLPQARIAELVREGAIGPDTTVKATLELVRGGASTRRFTQLDVIAGRLLAGSPDDLSPDVAAQLRRWLANQ